MSNRLVQCSVFFLMVTWSRAVFFLTVSGESSFCPSLCVCKWKSGKQSVECVDKNLIAIPEQIDPETQLLDVSGNNLQVLPNKTFVRAALLNLQRIYLKNCHIGQIDDEALSGLSNVVELDLSNNLLTSVPTSIFRDVPNLRDLSLARNPIQKIESRAFRHISGLVRLDLSHCKLESIASDAFADVSTLESLKLNGNNLRDLKPKTIEVLNGLHGVDLHDNPWYCDCNMRPIKIWLTAKNIPHPVQPVCSGGPMRVLNVSFKELAVDDFACKPEIKVKQESRLVEGVIGENATVTCRVESVPEAKVTWYWNGRPVLNNTAPPFGRYQRAVIIENGQMDKRSLLVVVNAQETDSSVVHCVAENRAGSVGANFTLRITHRVATFAMFTNGQMAGLSVALIFLIFSILVVIIYLLLRIKKIPSSSYQVKTRTIDDELPNGNVCRSSLEKQLSVSPLSDEHRTVVASGTAKNSGSMTANVGMYASSIECYNDAGSVLRYQSAVVGGAVGSGMGVQSINAPSYYAAEYLDCRKDSSNPDLIADTSRRLQYENCKTSYGHLPPAKLWSKDDVERYLASSGATSDFGTAIDSNDRTPIIESVLDLNEYADPPVGPLPNRLTGIENKILTGCSPSTENAISLPASSSAQAQSSVTANYPNAKTLRVWQKGVQVLPPVSTLKRALSRNSPDEGYQEGCGTDV